MSTPSIVPRFSSALRSFLLTALLAIALIPTAADAAAGNAYASIGNRGQHGDFDGIIKLQPNNSSTTFISGIRAFGMAFDGAKNLYVVDSGNHSVVKVAPDAQKTTLTTNLNRPLGIAFDSSFNFFVSDFGDNAVYKFAPDGTRTTFASSLSGPTGLAFDRSGNLFVSNTNSGTIFKITPGGTKTTFASGLDSPEGVAFDNDGNLYVAEFGPNVLKFTPDGAKTTFITGFVRAYGLAFSPNGDLYVSDNAGGLISIVSPDGKVQSIYDKVESPLNIAFEPGNGSRPLNLSTRMKVLTGNNVLIGGFIATGTVPKKLIVRATGPSLGNAGVAGFLADPILELRDSSGNIVASNDNWKTNDATGQSQESEIAATTVAPNDDHESALLASLQPGQSYTAIVRGVGDTTGIALVEAYDLETGADARFANISTRGFVDTGENVMIGGFILGGETASARLIVRAIGPSLASSGIAHPLPDPVLTVHDAQGTLVASNDNWKVDAETGQSQEEAVRATTVPPTDDLEAAVIVTLNPGAYTAIVSGKDGSTGVALVELYTL